MSWYRTYRPQTIAQLHLTSVREQLQRMMKSGSLPHALLFTGPKGTGKTSSARIIAKVVNCQKEGSAKGLHEPCNACDVCLDITAGRSVNVVEIDAATYGKVENVRDLKDQIYTPPPTGNKRVFIIDEIHMMSTSAFNALLKILEEPPAHVLFILATTEFHKLPETVVSRCTIVQFQKASPAEVGTALTSIAKQEKVTLDEEVIGLIVRRADGSFRDAVKVFEEIVSSGGKKLTKDIVEKLLPSLQGDQAEQLVQSILAKDEAAIIHFFQAAEKNGVNAQQLHKDLLLLLHQELLKSLGVEEGKAISSTAALQFLLKQYGMLVIDDRLPLPLLPLEITALEMVLKSKAQRSSSSGGSSSSPKSSPSSNGSTTQSGTTVVKRTAAVEEEMPLQAEESVVASVEENPFADLEEETTLEVESSIEPTSDVVPSNGSAQFADGSKLQDKWEDLLKTIGQKNLSIEALLRSSKFVRGEQGRVQIQVFYQFHKQQLELDRYRLVVQECIHQLIGGVVKVEYSLATSPSSAEVLGSSHSNVSGEVSAEVTELISMAEEALL